MESVANKLTKPESQEGTGMSLEGDYDQFGGHGSTNVDSQLSSSASSRSSSISAGANENENVKETIRKLAEATQNQLNISKSVYSFD